MDQKRDELRRKAQLGALLASKKRSSSFHTPPPQSQNCARPPAPSFPSRQHSAPPLIPSSSNQLIKPKSVDQQPKLPASSPRPILVSSPSPSPSPQSMKLPVPSAAASHSALSLGAASSARLNALLSGSSPLLALPVFAAGGSSNASPSVSRHAEVLREVRAKTRAFHNQTMKEPRKNESSASAASHAQTTSAMPKLSHCTFFVWSGPAFSFRYHAPQPVC